MKNQKAIKELVERRKAAADAWEAAFESDGVQMSTLSARAEYEGLTHKIADLVSESL